MVIFRGVKIKAVLLLKVLGIVRYSKSICPFRTLFMKIRTSFLIINILFLGITLGLLLGLEGDHGVAEASKKPDGIETPEEELAVLDLKKPDLIASAPRDIRLWRRGGRIELRFTGAFWNGGESALELISQTPKQRNRDEDVKLMQRLSNEGEKIDVDTGSLFWHGIHRHYHIDNVAYYILENLDIPSASTTLISKTSFCLVDTLQKDKKLMGTPGRSIYNTCGLTKQGLSVGWEDIYYFNYAGQGFDVTKLPAGNYRLTINVDPERKFIEYTRDNNIASTTFYFNPKTLRITTRN